VEMGQGNYLCYLQINTNLPMRKKLYLSLSWVAFLTEVETAITKNMLLQGMPPKLRDSENIHHCSS
jgi:hypothetical protein